MALHRHLGMATQGFFSVDSLAGVHALVIDSDQACRDLLSSILRYCGALVTTATSSTDALNVMSIAKCDVVVIDLVLHGEAGVDLIRRIRGLKPEQGGVVRAIAVSERGEDHDDAVASGFDAHLTKPLEPWMLCRLAATLVLGGRAAE